MLETDEGQTDSISEPPIRVPLQLGIDEFGRRGNVAAVIHCKPLETLSWFEPLIEKTRGTFAYSDLRWQDGQQLVQGNWEIPHADSSRVEYRVSDGGPRAAYAQLSEPFDAKHIGFVVESVEY